MRVNWLAASFFYFAIVFAAGFLFGTLRVMALEPQMGRTGAVLIELPFMLAISFFACRFSVKRYQVPAKILPRLAMGALAFVLLIAAELVLAMALGADTFETALARLTEPANRAGLGGQILFGAMPLMILVRRSRLSR